MVFLPNLSGKLIIAGDVQKSLDFWAHWRKKLANKKAVQKNTILVLAPMFPAINQPWMDTYIEQLLQKELSPLIYTENKEPGKYMEKVDRLNLRNYIISFDHNQTLSFKTFLKALILQPLNFVIMTFKATRITRYLFKKYCLSIIPTFLKLLRFGVSSAEFEHVDIVHAHSEMLAFEFMLFALMKDKPLLYTFHGLLPKGVASISHNKRKMLYGEVSAVLVNTGFAQQQVTRLGCPVKKVLILPQGLPLDDFPFVPRTAPTRNEPLFLLTVGRYHLDKGQRYALLALRRLIDAGNVVVWHFVGVGPDKSMLVSLAKKLGVADCSFFHTELNLEEICSLYQKCHLFVLPSLNSRKNEEHVETQGVVLQEAQASGCIPIATRVGGIPECLNDKEDSILIKDRSSRAIFDAVKYLMDRPDEWGSYQKKGRNNVEQNFSAAVIGQRMAEGLNKWKMLSR